METGSSTQQQPEAGAAEEIRLGALRFVIEQCLGDKVPKPAFSATVDTDGWPVQPVTQ